MGLQLLQQAPDAGEAAVRGFEALYGTRPTTLVRAPGRINLIGEHIDYCGLPVLPMSVQRAVWVASSPAEGKVARIASRTPGLESVHFEVGPDVPPAATGDWGNYARAAVVTMSREYGASTPFDGYVASDLPIAAGLSSSSALVVAVSISCLAAEGREIPERVRLAERLARGERYVGTAGGGMDQATVLLGVAGHALELSFDPLHARPVPVPGNWRVIVAYSGQRAEKSGEAQGAYNRLTRAAAAAADHLSARRGAGARGLAAYGALVGSASADALLAEAETALDGAPLRVFRHVVTESDRVQRTLAALEAGDLPAAGAALDGSHLSLADNLGVSTPALDELVERMREAGAVGARLTGAGMGGCAIGLCTADASDSVLEAARRFETRSGGPPVAFVAEPSDGARVVAVR